MSQPKCPVFQYQSRKYLGLAAAFVALQGCVSASMPIVTPAEFGTCVKISLDTHTQGSTRSEHVQYVADPNCVKDGRGCVTTFCRKCVVSAEIESELLPCASIPEATTESGVEVSAEADLGDLNTEDDGDGDEEIGDDGEEGDEDDDDKEQAEFDDFDDVSGGGGVHRTLAEVSSTESASTDTGNSRTEAIDAGGDNSKSEDAEFDSELPNISEEKDQERAEVSTSSANLTGNLESGLLDTFESLLATISTTAVATNLAGAALSELAGASDSELTPEAGVEAFVLQATTQNGAVSSATSTNSNANVLLSGGTQAGAITLDSSPFPCEASQGDVDVGISAVVDAFCVNGGLGCFKGGCRQCRFKDTPKSMHLDVCPK